MAIAICAIMMAYPQDLQAGDGGLTGQDVVGWPKDNQAFYIQSSITMAGVIASKSKPHISKCIDAWYFSNSQKMLSVNQHIVAHMKEHYTYHPSGIILALIEKECGSF